MVPGNHDVDWSVLNIPDASGLRKKQRYEPLLHDELIFAEIVSNGHQNMCVPPHFRTWNFGGLYAIGYNSAWHDEPNEKVHHGLISQSHLKELEELLISLALEESCLKV